MWMFRVKRPPGSPPVFKARYVARGFRQRQGANFFHTFSPTPKMTTLRVLLHVAAQCDYELHSLDFSTAFLQGSLHEEIWLRRPPGFTRSFPAGTQWSLRRPVYGLRQAPHELVFATADTEALAHMKSELQKRHTCIDLGELTSYLGLRITRDRAQRTITLTQSHMVLQRFGFTYSSPQSTPLPTGHSLSAPPSGESVEPSGPYPELVGCLMHRKVHWDAAKRVLRYLCSTLGMGLVLGVQARVVLTSHADASWVDDLATQRSSQGYTFSLGSGSVSWQSTPSSSVLSFSCEAEIYAGAMAAQELRCLTYLLTDLGEVPRSPPVLYVDNKAMLALCQEHRLEHRTKHIALRYFLARELQQRGQLRFAYVASQANTADVFTKALQPCDHQRFCTVLGLHQQDADSSGGNARGEEVSCLMVSVVEPTILLALEAGLRRHAAERRRAPHPQLQRALEGVEGRGTIALQGEARKQVVVPDVLYVSGVHANLMSAGQLKENSVKLQDESGEMLLVSSAGDVLGRARFSGRILCSDLRPCSTMSSTEVVALRTIAPATKLTPDMLHLRLVHVGVDTIKSSAKHEVAAGLDIKKSTAADLPSASCVSGKLARHTFPDQPLLKDRKTRYLWMRPIAKKSDVLVVFLKWLKEVERQTSKMVKKLRSDCGGEFLGCAFTDLVEDKGILHNLTCPCTPQQNGMAEREMRTVVEAVRTMLLHMGVKHHWWHLALRQAVWVRNCLDRASLPSGTTPHELLFEKKPDLILANVWGCMV
ncbi:unnamed protein product [Closterium sp. NIES-54]